MSEFAPECNPIGDALLAAPRNGLLQHIGCNIRQAQTGASPVMELASIAKVSAFHCKLTYLDENYVNKTLFSFQSVSLFPF